MKFRVKGVEASLPNQEGGVGYSSNEVCLLLAVVSLSPSKIRGGEGGVEI